MRKYVVEFGLGIDYHGRDVNASAQKAMQDALRKIQTSSMPEIQRLDELDGDVSIHATVAVSQPKELDTEALTAFIPQGRITVAAIPGGLHLPNLKLSRFVDDTFPIEVAVVALEIGIKTA